MLPKLQRIAETLEEWARKQPTFNDVQGKWLLLTTELQLLSQESPPAPSPIHQQLPPKDDLNEIWPGVFAILNDMDRWVREWPDFERMEKKWETLLTALQLLSQESPPAPVPERPTLPPPPIPKELPPKRRLIESLIRDYEIVNYRMVHPDSLVVYFHVMGIWKDIGSRLRHLRDVLAEETAPQPMPKGKNKDKVTPEMQEEILAWKGSKKELAAKLGISRQTIHAVLRKNSPK